MEDAPDATVTATTLRKIVGTTEEVVLGRYAIRVAVQDLYQPRGELLSKAQANAIVNGTILPQASFAYGVPWVKAAWLEAFIAGLPAAAQNAYRKNGSKGGRPRNKDT